MDCSIEFVLLCYQTHVTFSQQNKSFHFELIKPVEQLSTYSFGTASPIYHHCSRASTISIIEVPVAASAANERIQVLG
jgi:hypothetical protein